MRRETRQAPEIRVLMVCLGNICRSPTAQGVFQKLIENAGLTDHIEVDSAGTANYHIGEKPDNRAIVAAARRGYELQSLVARQINVEDYRRFDYILAMDRNNLKDLRAHCPPTLRSRLGLLLHYADSGYDVVPDPYYSSIEQGFELVLDLVEQAGAGLLQFLCERHFAHLARPSA